ncbi:MAG: right-handed parallel beta-helix repeat-containing protein [Candidatus Acetothermia bacterium]|nr:right-handed parallel beta-helix repeat-containing protein [Candidatus Acetothermia bacterium]
MALAISGTAFGKELRVTTAPDLVNCVTGAPLGAGPDAGKVAAAGDTCVVFPGTYNLGTLAANIFIENLTLRSTNGATATIITGARAGGLVNIVNRGVTIGGPAADQGFTITNTAGAGICVTDPLNTTCDVVGAPPPGVTPAPAIENITIQNNTLRANGAEAILFTYMATNAIDTIRILNNEIRNNAGDGLQFDNTVGAIGRRGLARNVVIDGNIFDDNGNGVPLPAGAFSPRVPPANFANIHFFNSTTVEQLAIINNEIYRAGAATPPADGIRFCGPVTEVRDTIIDRNLIQFNTRNGIAFDYIGRLGENVTISNNRGATPDQGITHNGPAAVPGTGQGNGIYITQNITDVRDLKIVNNAINSNRGWDETFPPASSLVPCRHGNGLAIEANGRVESLLLDGNDFRQNFNNGVCIANNGDFDRSTVTNNKFHNNGVGDYIGLVIEAPYGDGFGVYHDSTINGSAVAWGEGFRIESITFSGNDYRENGGNPSAAPGAAPAGSSGLGFGVFMRTERAEISRISFENENATRNFLGGFRLETDTDLPTVRSGDIREITFTNVTAIESQAEPGIGGNTYDVGDNGDGIALATDNGDQSMVTVTNTTGNGNGTFGLRLESDASAGGKPEAATVVAGDIDTVKIKDGAFNFNGTRGAVGRGSGILIAGDSVRNVTIDPTTCDTNNDHGVQVSGTRNVSNILVENSHFAGNDRNRDTVGDGVQVNANEDLSNITVRNNTASGNYAGIRTGAAGRQIGQNITIEGNTAENNTKEGIALYAGRDLITGIIKGNKLVGNGIGVSIDVIQRGTGIEVSENQIHGANGLGTGVLLNSTGTKIHDNAIRRNAVGVEVRKVMDNAINQNNIARNEKFGVDASALQPGESIDATNNWWGEPSGPKHSTNPNGIGDRVTDKVNYKPFLDKPVCSSDLICPSYMFTIKSFTGPTSADKGVAVQYIAEIQNTGTEEGTQEITLIVSKGGTVVGTKSVTKTINPSAATTVTFDYKFTEGGDFTVELKTNDDSKTINVHVTGPIMLTIEQAVAQHSGSPTIIEDPDITWAVELWVEDTIVPGTDGLKIDDAKILQLVGMWIDGTPVAMAAGQSAQPQKKGFNFFEWLGSFFATRSAVEINHQASPSRVAPGEAFTVTVAFNGEVKGLLLTESLPAGWTITPLENSSAFYKPSETKWLVLGAGTVSYKVTVPADAAPGSYTIAGSYTTSDGSGAVRPLSIEVAGAPVALKVDAVKFTGSRFVVEGVGVASVEARVWNLAGSLVFSGKATGNALAVDGGAWANGVYLYAVTVRGADGAVVQTEVRKLVVLR